MTSTRPFDDLRAVFARLPVCLPTMNSATGEDTRPRCRKVIAAGVGIDLWRPAELSIHRIVVDSKSPRSDKSLISVAQPASSSADKRATASKLFWCVSQPAPPDVRPNDTSTKGDAPFDQSAGQQAALTEHTRSVSLSQRVRFIRQIERTGAGAVHQLERTAVNRVLRRCGIGVVPAEESALQRAPQVQPMLHAVAGDPGDAFDRLDLEFRIVRASPS